MDDNWMETIVKIGIIVAIPSFLIFLVACAWTRILLDKFGRILVENEVRLKVPFEVNIMSWNYNELIRQIRSNDEGSDGYLEYRRKILLATKMGYLSFAVLAICMGTIMLCAVVARS